MINLSQTFKAAGIIPGDVVEIWRETGELLSSLSGLLNESTPAVDGLLINVTGIGEATVLGFIMEGEPMNDVGSGYRMYRWSRQSDKECQFQGQYVLRKVGQYHNNAIEWIYPDLINIYSRTRND